MTFFATSPLLSIVTFLPLVGALFIAFLPRTAGGDRNARHAALYTTVFTFAISLLIWINFDPAHGGLPVCRGKRLDRTRSATRWASTASRCCS